MITSLKKLYRKSLDNITRIYFKIHILYTKIYSIVFFTNMPDIKTHLTLEEKYFYIQVYHTIASVLKLDHI